jgi:hypothetical protein
MKKIISIITATAILFTACTKDDSLPQNNNSNSTVITGDFTITKFTDNGSGENKVSDSNGCVFTFSTDGKIIAEKNGVSFQGNYTEKPSHEGEGAKLGISFSDAPLNELDKNWQIELITNSAIHLKDDDTSSGEVLEFTAK